MRSTIDSHIVQYRNKLITTLKDAQSLNQPELSQRLIAKHKWLQDDICFLIDCGMVYKTPVYIDQKVEKHKPDFVKKQFLNDLLYLYCVFTEAQRILLAFCTFSTLTGTMGYTTVQVPFKRADFPDPNSHWGKEFRKIRPRNGMVLQV